MNRTQAELIRDTKPFSKQLIKQRPPRDESYVPWLQYAQRLLLNYGGYTWHVIDVQTTHQTDIVRDKAVDRGTVWVVVGTLYLGEQPDADSQSYSAVGEDSSAAAAEANAFKRACSRAGIGLHLYGTDDNPYWLHDTLRKNAARPTVDASDISSSEPKTIPGPTTAGGDDGLVNGLDTDVQHADDEQSIKDNEAAQVYAEDDPERPF